MNPKHSHFPKLGKQLLAEITGCVLVAAAIYNFAAQAAFPMTGFSGISLLLYRLLRIPIGLSTILLNIPVSILCCRLLGKNFFLSSLRCMLLTSVLIDYVAPLFPIYQGSRLLAALCTGVIGGWGYSMIYMQGSSTGGMDFIIMAVKTFCPHLSLGKITLLADVGIVLAGGLLFQDIDGIIYGMIVSYLFARMVDKAVYGVNTGKLALVITRHGQKTSNAIQEHCRRGSTILHAQGGYRGQKNQLVMCACSNREVYLLQRVVKEADPQSFLIILESNEVHGEGFRTFQIGESEPKG